MRLFVAVDVSDEVREYAVNLRRALCRQVRRLERELRWVDAGQLHVTLRFIGDVEAAVADRLRRRLEVPLSLAPFTIEPGEPGWLPATSRPRVLILGFRQGSDQLRALHDTIDERVCGEVTIESDHRTFLPHVTLARARDPRRLRPVALDAAVVATRDEERPTAGVDQVTLYESHLSPAGPTYVPLARGRLTGTA